MDRGAIGEIRLIRLISNPLVYSFVIRGHGALAAAEEQVSGFSVASVVSAAAVHSTIPEIPGRTQYCHSLRVALGVVY